MRVRNWVFWTGTLAIAGLLVVPALTAAEASGPAKGSTVPLLHVDPFNDNDTEYCVTCRAGKMPTVVTLITADTAGSRDALVATDEAYRAGADKNLKGAAILIGSNESTAALRAFAAEKKLALPVAVAAADYKDIPSWKVNSKVATTVVLIKDRKVVDSLTDPDHQSVKNGVAALTN